VEAFIPERYCSLDIVTRGGNVQTAGVTEALYRVRSGGGDVTVGKVRATHAAVDSGGGSVSGSLTASGVLSLQAT
jgi:hypothetical protein